MISENIQVLIFKSTYKKWIGKSRWGQPIGHRVERTSELDDSELGTLEGGGIEQKDKRAHGHGQQCGDCWRGGGCKRTKW